MDDLELGGTADTAYEDDEVAEVIARCPEIADLPDWYDAAQLLAMDLDLLDADGWEGLL